MIRDAKVVGLTPSSWAAPPGPEAFPPAAFRAARGATSLPRKRRPAWATTSRRRWWGPTASRTAGTCGPRSPKRARSRAARCRTRSCGPRSSSSSSSMIVQKARSDSAAPPVQISPLSFSQPPLRDLPVPFLGDLHRQAVQPRVDPLQLARRRSHCLDMSATIQVRNDGYRLYMTGAPARSRSSRMPRRS